MKTKLYLLNKLENKSFSQNLLCHSLQRHLLWRLSIKNEFQGQSHFHVFGFVCLTANILYMRWGGRWNNIFRKFEMQCVIKVNRDFFLTVFFYLKGISGRKLKKRTIVRICPAPCFRPTKVLRLVQKDKKFPLLSTSKPKEKKQRSRALRPSFVLRRKKGALSVRGENK